MNKVKLLGTTVFMGILTLGFSAPLQAQEKSGSATQGFGMFLPLILIFAIFYLLIVRPQQKQAKKRKEMISTVQKGDQVVTTGGIHGRIVGVTEGILTLEIADNCKVKIERNGIQTVKKD